MNKKPVLILKLKIMKKLALISLSMIFALSIFGQVSKYPPKVVAIFLSEKHPQFDESKYSDIDFYYIIKKKYKNPEGMLKGITGATNLLFDKNGILITQLGYSSTNSSIGEAYSKSVRKKVVTDDELFDYTYLDEYTKTYIKKGKEMKPGKNLKSKHPEMLSDDYESFKLPDFKVTDINGKEYSFNSLVTGEPLTLVVFMSLYYDSWDTPEQNAIGEIKKLN